MTPPSSSRESTGRAWRLARKELREILRDRRTVITLILMPLLVYPLLGTVMSKGVLTSLAGAKSLQLYVYVENPDQQQTFMGALQEGDRLLSGKDEAAGTKMVDNESTQVLLLHSDPDLQVSVFIFPYQEGRHLEDAVTAGEADIGIRVRLVEPYRMTQTRRPRPFREWQVIHRKESALSERGLNVITRSLNAFNDRYLDHLVSSQVIPPVRPETINPSAMTSGEQSAKSPLVTFIPLVLVLMTMTGAVYPAIDLTAGERERGTMEILVAAPVPRMTLLAGKFVAVLVVALLTASINLASMFATLFAIGLDGTILGNIGPGVIFQVAVLMVVFAAFFSAVLLSITSVARSFKEAQAYLIPLMLISLTPGIFALLPDIKINALLAVTPLVNTVLLARDLLQNNINILMFAIALISTALYGVLALSLAARIFGSDAVLYGSTGSWSDLLRRPQQSNQVASIPVAMSCLAILFSAFVVLGGLPGRLTSELNLQLLLNAAILAVLFVGLPLAAARASRVNFSTGFALQTPRVSAWLIALLLGCSLWPFLYEIQILSMTQARIEFLQELFDELKLNLTTIPFWLKLFALAVAPAVCEEFFFRGFLQTAIRHKASAALSIVATGVLFGLFHVVVKDALLFERLIPSTLMGITLGIIFEYSGSVLPGMLLHVVHNGLLISLAQFEEKLRGLGIDLENQQHLPAWILGCAAVPALIAVSLLARRRKSPTA